MNHEENAFREIGAALAKHFECLYYIDIETGNYEEFIHMNLFDKYLSYWPVIAASLVFFILGLWWQLSAARAMTASPAATAWPWDTA